MESDDQDDQTLTQDIANLSGELGDDAPASSLGRAPNLRRDIGVSPARVLALLDEAATRIAGALSRQVDDDVGARVDAASPPTRTPRGPCQARRPTTETQPVWRAVLDALGQVLTVENVNAWLASTRALDQDGEAPRVVQPGVASAEAGRHVAQDRRHEVREEPIMFSMRGAHRC